MISFLPYLCSSYLFTFLSLTLPNFYPLTLSSSPLRSSPPHSSSPYILIPSHYLYPLTFSHPHPLTPSPLHTTPTHTLTSSYILLIPSLPHILILLPLILSSPPHRMHHSIPLCLVQPWRMWWSCRVPCSQTTPSLGLCGMCLCVCVCVCVCACACVHECVRVCVCVREKERERTRGCHVNEGYLISAVISV